MSLLQRPQGLEHRHVTGQGADPGVLARGGADRVVPEYANLSLDGLCSGLGNGEAVLAGRSRCGRAADSILDCLHLILMELAATIDRGHHCECIDGPSCCRGVVIHVAVNAIE